MPLGIRAYRIASLLGIAMLSGACLPVLPHHGMPSPDTYRVTTDVRFHLARREFLLHVPPVPPRALVVVLHGAFSTARQTERETGFSALADREGFLVAYPEGNGILGWLQHWNAGHCCGKAAADAWDDVGFVAEVIRVVRQRFEVDSKRVFLAGMSNGGMLAYRFAAERGREVAAIAVVAGASGSRSAANSEPWRLPEPSSPLPVLVVHGTADEHIPYNGGISPAKGGERAYQSVADAVNFWRNANRCTATAETTTWRNGAVEQDSWRDCDTGRPVVRYTLKGWGHTWPAPHVTAQLPAEHPLWGFDATAVAWDFFQNP